MKKVLIADTPGTMLRLSGERVSFLRQGKVEEIPIRMLEEVRIGRGVRLSSDLLISLAEYGVLVTLVNDKGDPRGLVTVPTSGGTVKTRREQIRGYDDERGVKLAKSFVTSATLFRAWVLKRLAKSRPEVSLDLKESAGDIEEVVEEIEDLQGNRIEDIRSELMALEGKASSKYFSMLSLTIPKGMFSGQRTRRPPRDPFNAAISYANSMVYTESLKCVIFSGLDPYAGFLHADRPGRFSMALDLAEEFLVYASHWTVITLTTRGVLKEGDFGGTPEGGIHLTYEGRRKVSRSVNNALRKPVPYQGRRWRLRDLILLRARQVVTFLRGESDYDTLVPWE